MVSAIPLKRQAKTSLPHLCCRTRCDVTFARGSFVLIKSGHIELGVRTHAADQTCHHRSVATRRHIVRIHEAVSVGISAEGYPRDDIVSERVLETIKAVVDHSDFDVMFYLIWNIQDVFGKSIYMFQPYLSDRYNLLAVAVEQDEDRKVTFVR
jgi:hypothetical protein